jgi:hypothetical protein
MFAKPNFSWTSLCVAPRRSATREKAWIAVGILAELVGIHTNFLFALPQDVAYAIEMATRPQTLYGNAVRSPLRPG